MKTITVDLLTNIENNAVLRIPERQFPGILVQGDSLWILLQRAKEIHDRTKALGDEDLVCESLMLKEWLESVLDKYEAALMEHGISLPYSKQDL